MRLTIILTIILILGLLYAVQDNGITQVLNPQFKGAKLTIPKSINFQGYLYRDGTPMDTTMNMWFGIYDALTIGNLIFEQTINNILISNGWFSVTLNDIPDTVFPVTGPTQYLEIKAPATEPPLTPRLQLASVGYAYHAATADTAEFAKSGIGIDDAWMHGSDSVLYTIRNLGIAKGGAGNKLYGDQAYTHVNLGVACTTGTSGQNYFYCTVSGGERNTANGMYSTVGGGFWNTASAYRSTVGGGAHNTASGMYASVIGGGYDNTASGWYATVCGGGYNTASYEGALVGGGAYNKASNHYTTVCGGSDNTASGVSATIGGGSIDTAASSYSFAVGYHSVVPAGYDNSAAFNGTRATGSNQTRVNTLVQGSGVFAMDHPLDPTGKILNRYAMESPEMIINFRGVACISNNGQVEVNLPDYFDALCRNPMIQLTGVGTHEVFVANEIIGNRFVIGGKSGTKVYWTVTGERKDQTAEITRIITPVEQQKTEQLVGISLDDDALVSTMQQLKKIGKANQFNFRTSNGRRQYEDMKRNTSRKINIINNDYRKGGLK